MPLCPSHLPELNLALDEALVRSVRWDVPTARVRLALRVLARPADDPSDLDRELVLHDVSRVRVLLRRDRSGTLDYGPPVPLAGQDDLEDFLSSLCLSDAMHDGKPLDDASPTDDWPATVSLTVDFPRPAGAHTLYWFTECARDEPGGTVGYLLEGLVAFDDLTVHRRDGRPLSFERFVEDHRRWWLDRMRPAPGLPR